MLQTREEVFNAYPYIAERSYELWDLGFPPAALSAMKEWCHNNIRAGGWSYSCGNFFFREDKDRLLFVMTWS